MDSQRDLDLSSMADAAAVEGQVRLVFQKLTDRLRDQPARSGRILAAQEAFEAYLSAQLAIFDRRDDGTSASLKRNKTAEMLWLQRLQTVHGLTLDICPDEDLK